MHASEDKDRQIQRRMQGRSPRSLRVKSPSRRLVDRLVQVRRVKRSARSKPIRVSSSTITSSTPARSPSLCRSACRCLLGVELLPDEPGTRRRKNAWHKVKVSRDRTEKYLADLAQPRRLVREQTGRALDASDGEPSLLPVDLRRRYSRRRSSAARADGWRGVQAGDPCDR
jgi:hypothetical protein